MDFFLEYVLGWNLPALICLIVGIVLLIVEMFIPGFGLAGGIGLASLVAAIVLRADTLQNALITLALILLILLVFGYFFFRSFSRGALSRSRMVLNEAIRGGSTSLTQSEIQQLVGREGVALNLLRPAGNADFDGTRLDVVTSGEFIEKGKRVRIERVEGMRILVKEISRV
ncbi:MAG: NfeD family protein [Bacillota bacterium]